MKIPAFPTLPRDFTLVVLGQIISLFGNSILHFALPLYLLRESGSSALFGAVNACAFLPMVLMAPIGGVVADRVNKRNIMVCLDFFTSGLMVLYLLLWGRLPLVPLTILCLMLLYGIAGAYQPSVQASVPLLLPRERLTAGNAAINAVNTLANLLGPVLGGVLLGMWGLRPILVVSAGCFFLSAVMELFIRIPHMKQPRSRGVLATVGADLAESWQYIRRERPVFLSATLILAAFNLILSAALIVGVPVLVTGALHMSDAHLGLTQGAMGLGGLAGGLIAGLLGRRLRPRHGSWLLLTCSAAVAVMGLALLPGVSAAAGYRLITGMGALVMCAATLFSVLLISLLQQQTAPALIGKVIACIQAAANCASPLGQARYGLLFDSLAHWPWLVLFGAAALSALVGLWAGPVFRRLGEEMP